MTIVARFAEGAFLRQVTGRGGKVVRSAIIGIITVALRGVLAAQVPVFLDDFPRAVVIAIGNGLIKMEGKAMAAGGRLTPAGAVAKPLRRRLSGEQREGDKAKVNPAHIHRLSLLTDGVCRHDAIQVFGRIEAVSRMTAGVSVRAPCHL